MRVVDNFVKDNNNIFCLDDFWYEVANLYSAFLLGKR